MADRRSDDRRRSRCRGVARWALPVLLAAAGLTGCGGRAPQPEQPAAASDDVFLPMESMRRIEAAAEVAGRAWRCGLDWLPYFQSFMAAERRRATWSREQDEMIAIYFGDRRGLAFEQARKLPCGPAMRRGLAKKLARGF